ncbi:MAG: putative phage abortive infection protein [Bacteroidota bacterium]|jgi:hypothetical protein
MSKDNRISTGRLWFIGIGIVLVLWAGSWLYIVSCFSGLKEWNERGSFGDMFGAVSSLFSGLAFVALIITINLQRRTLQDTKEDTERLAFESQFFQLIRVHINIIEGIEQQYSTYLMKGRQWLSHLWENLSKNLDSELSKTTNEQAIVVIQRVYGKFFEDNEHHLGHYFRHLYHIVAFVDRSSLSRHEKQSYMKLLRAQLSSHELLLIFYNCLSTRGINKFKPLTEKYALFEHMPKPKDDHKNLYNATAFSEE